MIQYTNKSDHIHVLWFTEYESFFIIDDSDVLVLRFTSDTVVSIMYIQLDYQIHRDMIELWLSLNIRSRPRKRPFSFLDSITYFVSPLPLRLELLRRYSLHREIARTWTLTPSKIWRHTPFESDSNLAIFHVAHFSLHVVIDLSRVTAMSMKFTSNCCDAQFCRNALSLESSCHLLQI